MVMFVEYSFTVMLSSIITVGEGHLRSPFLIAICANRNSSQDVYIFPDYNVCDIYMDSSHYCELIVISSDDENKTKYHGIASIVIKSIGFFYVELLEDISWYWGAELDHLAVISDVTGSGFSESVIHSLKDGTSVIVVNGDINSTNINVITKSRYFLLVGQVAFIQVVLQKASSLNLLSPSNTWILVSTDGPIPEENFCHGIVLSLTDNYIDGLNTTIRSTLNTFKMNNAFPNCSDSIFKDIEKNIQATEIEINLTTLHENTELLHLLWKSYFTQNQSNLTQSQNSGFKNMSDLRRLQQPIPMPTIRIAAVHEPPYVFKTDTVNGTMYTGYLIDILQDLSTHVNFAYIISDCSEGVYGIQRNSIWNGCIGDIVNNRADMVLAPLAVTSERHKVVDFLKPYIGSSGLQVLRKRSTPTEFVFMNVFTTDVWLSSIAVIIITSVVLYMYQRYSIQDSLQRLPASDAVWFVVSSLCFQGSDTRIVNSCSRIVIAGFWFFSAIFMACFTADMAAMLTHIRLEDNSCTVLGELKSKTTNFTVIASSYEFAYIYKVAELEEVFEQIWKEQMYKNTYKENNTVWTYPLKSVFTNLLKNILQNSLPNSTIKALNMVKQNYKLITDSTVATYLRNTYCNFLIVSEPIATHPVGLAVTKGFELTRNISERLLLLQQTQTFENLKRKWWGHVTTCSSPLDENKGLTITKLRRSFYMLLIGIIAAVVILILEVLYNKVKYKINQFSSTFIPDSNSLTKNNKEFSDKKESIVHHVSTVDDDDKSQKENLNEQEETHSHPVVNSEIETLLLY